MQVPALDQLLTSATMAAGIRPDLVLQLGERLVSKCVCVPVWVGDSIASRPVSWLVSTASVFVSTRACATGQMDGSHQPHGNVFVHVEFCMCMHTCPHKRTQRTPGSAQVSKRVLELVTRASAVEGCCRHVVVSDAPGRQDPSASASLMLNCSPLQLAKAVSVAGFTEARAVAGEGALECGGRATRRKWTPSELLPLRELSQRCMAELEQRLAATAAPGARARLEEPWVAVEVACKGVRAGGALFVSSSMPIRDLDMYAAVVGAGRQAVVAMGSNRGASGIDGVLSSAVGFCCGMARPVTLLIGDTALLHDIGKPCAPFWYRVAARGVVDMCCVHGIHTYTHARTRTHTCSQHNELTHTQHAV